ncbi:MAG: PilZ domain-containing protein [Deltaproteobacteria bacterium]|nr:PilZ domain-containing protein [Deltaproteobacteria bacterium]
MKTIKGTYKNGKIVFFEPVFLPKSSKVIVTANRMRKDCKSKGLQSLEAKDVNYNQIRKNERIRAHGKITILHKDEKNSFHIYDYSKGGLCFLSHKDFAVDDLIHAGIMDPHNEGSSLMELKLSVRGVFENEGKRQVGCRFEDPLDEDLWHGLMQFIG